MLGAWPASPGHTANIERAAFTHHGVGKVGTYWIHVCLVPTTSGAARK